jgi:hypothetical protein
MTIRLTFDLTAVRRLAEHAATAAGHVYPAGTGHTGPALLLSSGSDGIWLTSNGLPISPAPAGQPGSLDRLAVFAAQCPPGTPLLEPVELQYGETPLAEAIPLHQPANHPLLAQLRDAADAGYTALTVVLSSTGLDLTVSRQTTRSRRLAR